MTSIATERVNDSARLRGRRRVLHLLAGRVFGGAEEHALSILSSIRAYGFDPFLAAPNELIAAMEPRLSEAGVQSIGLEFSSRLDVLSGARLLRFIRRENIALLHCHLFNASLVGAGIARMAGVDGVIETCHGPEVWRMGKGLRGSFWVDRQIGRMIDVYIAVSHAAARHLIENKRVPKSKIRVIHNGRELSRFNSADVVRRRAIRDSLGLGDEPTVLTVARLDEQKGHRHLIDALAKVASRRPSVVALLAGEGPLEASLRGQCEALGVTERVKFLGYRGDVPELFAAADVVVLPSLYEGLPLVAIEALAAARPLVATEVDGTPEVVTNEKTGLLVAPANPVALAAAIERVFDNPELASRLASSGRDFVHENFAVQRQIEQTAALYSELTGFSREGEAA